MMPGENQSGAGGVALEATSGTCQNCTVLSQSLDEYVAALLTLKQKIIDTDLLLSQYKEKCDELQKSQRVSTKLHKELDEVLLKLGPMEKQAAEFEAVRAELEETTAALKAFQAKSDDVTALREENTKALEMNLKLEETLRKAEDAANTQSLETAALRSEKAALESDLQKTRESLRLSQQAVEEAENLKLQNAKTLILKSDLENQLLVLEDTNLKQDHTIRELKSKNCSLEKGSRLIEEKLGTLEREFNKEKRCLGTQTDSEPKVDKAKVWSLLQEVWHCVDPLSNTPAHFNLNDDRRLMLRPSRCPPCPVPFSPLRNQMPRATAWTPKGAELSPVRSASEPSLIEASSPSKDQRKRMTGKKRDRRLESEEESCGTTEVGDLSPNNKDGPVGDLLKDGRCSGAPGVWEILSLCSPLPAPLSPLPPDDLAEMEVDSSLKETPISKAEDGEQSQSTEPNPLECSLAGPAVHLSEGKQSSMATSMLAPDTDTKSLLDMPVENRPVEKVGEITTGNGEGLPCIDATPGSQNESDGESVSFNQAKIVTAESPPSTKGDTNHLKIKLQCNADPEIPQANSNEGVSGLQESEGSEPVQTVIVSEECPDKEDNSAQSQSEVEADLPGYSLPISSTTQTSSKSEPERTVDEIQSVSSQAAAATVFKTAEVQNGNGGPDNGLSCTEVDGHLSEGSSDEEELLGLKSPKVREACSRPADSDSVTVSKPLLNEEQELVDPGATNGTEEEEHPQPENNKDDGCLTDGVVTTDMCKPVILEDEAGKDAKQEAEQAESYRHESENCSSNSFGDLEALDHQEECVVSGSFTVENTDDGSNEYCAKPEGASGECQDVCPASSVKTTTLSSLRTCGNRPPTDVSSSDALASTEESTESIGKVLMEMGPPLPPVLLPLAATPPRLRKQLTPNRPSIQLPTWSSTEGPFSLKHRPKGSSPDPGLQDEVTPPLSLTTPSPSRGVPSSPLQFGSATPKHALPVPGRLPSSALNSPSHSASQENSMQMLDTMYPELSAQARTLNILRGNMNLGRAANDGGVSSASVASISGNKTINSSSTAFTKTDQKAKRIGANVLLPKSAKRLRLDTCSPDPTGLTSAVQGVNHKEPVNGVVMTKTSSTNGPSGNDQMAKTEGKAAGVAKDAPFAIFSALEKLQASCFDVLPVIRSHIFLGRISEVPVLRDEEKCVISDFCSNQSSAEEFMLVVLSKIKAERAVMKHELLQSYCRVYVGLCRRRGECQKAHALAYSVLKEDFPEAPKLILFMVTTWPAVLSHDSALCRAVNTVSRQKADGEILDYLSKYLHWDERPPGDIHEMIPSILKTLFEDGTLMFQKRDRHGDDLCSAAWEYIFSLDLLCAHLGWKWTHDNIIGKELWPVMNTWVTQPRSQQAPVRDICVAAVLRLIGRLGQLGLKEKLCGSVQNVAKAINLFGKHGISEGVPWEVQLSAVYTIYDLAPSNPKEALEALASWRGEITETVPPAVTSCITQIGSICRQIQS